VKFLSPIRSLLEILSFILLAANALLFALAHYNLPETSYLFQGVEFPDKLQFTLVFWIAFLVYGALFVLKRFPHLMVYPVKLTAANINFQTQWGRLMLAALTLPAMAALLIIMVDFYRSFTMPGVAVHLLAVILLLASMPILFLIYYIVAKKKA